MVRTLRSMEKSVALLTMSATRKFLPALLLASGVAVTACAGQDSAPQPPADTPSTSASSAASSNSSTPQAAPSSRDAPSVEPTSPSNNTAPNASDCAAGELSVSLGAEQGAAGSALLPIVFTNIGNRTCTLDGYPGVSYVSSPGGAQVGQAAVRSESEPEAVTLTPGASAQSLVKATVAQNYSTEACQPAPVSGIDVYSPNTTEVVYLAYPTTGCSTTDPSITQLAVQPVRAE